MGELDLVKCGGYYQDIVNVDSDDDVRTITTDQFGLEEACEFICYCSE